MRSRRIVGASLPLRFRPFVLVPLLLAGCSSVHVVTDWDRDTNFSGYRSFEFAPSPAEKKGPTPGNRAFLDKRIKRAVEAELTAKGFVLRESGRADLLVVYYLKLQDVVNVYTYGHYPRRWGGAASVHRYKEGTLVLDLVDRNLDEVVWRGWGEGIRADVQRSEEKIHKAVAKILKKFPPQ